MLAKIILTVVLAAELAHSDLYSNFIRPNLNVVPQGFGNPSYGNILDIFRGINNKRRCPICDPSVYSYCTDKLFHDSCCCHNPNNPYDTLPYQCSLADCSFLHANSCQEHKLITACCCYSK